MPSQGELIQSFWRVLNLAKLQSSARLFSLRRNITLFLSHCFGVETRETVVWMIKVTGVKGALGNFSVVTGFFYWYWGVRLAGSLH